MTFLALPPGSDASRGGHGVVGLESMLVGAETVLVGFKRFGCGGVVALRSADMGESKLDRALLSNCDSAAADLRDDGDPAAERCGDDGRDIPVSLSAPPRWRCVGFPFAAQTVHRLTPHDPSQPSTLGAGAP